MQLNPAQLAELNTLLADKNLDIPEFRREVRPSGASIEWLRKNLLKRNPNASPALRKLLGI